MSSRRGFTEVTRRWEGEPGRLGPRRSRQAFVYRAYVPDTVSGWEPQVGASVVAALSDAEEACRRLDPHPLGLGTLDALTRQLLRSEAVASSRIEGLRMSHRRLAFAQSVAGHDDRADEVLANISAMERAVEVAAVAPRIGVDDLCAIHATLLAGTRDERVAGLLRTEQNWIGGEASSPAGAEFVPPPPDDVPRLVADLTRFMDRRDLPPALHAALVHAQFETIHPFADGNGRVGRALIHLVLQRSGLRHGVVPPISLALGADADRYVAGLTSYRFGDYEDWVALFADALARSARAGEGFAHDVAALRGRWAAAAGSPRRGSTAEGLIRLLPGRPVLTTPEAAHELGVSHEAARKALNRLADAGVVRDRAAGRRLRVWEAVGLFDVLDRLERRVGNPARAPRPTRAPGSL